MLNIPHDPDEIERLLRHMTDAERKEFLRLVGGLPPTFGQFVEQTLNVKLDPWQVLLCNRLERLVYERGQRLLIHGPPRHGKSVIISQRLPAYILGLLPTYSIVLASHNQTHSIEFSKVVLGVLRSPEFQQIFPSEACRLAVPTPQHQWFTRGRLTFPDGQPSFTAIGMDSGFVGKGADLLIVDDPYSSASDAFSVAVNNNIRVWWTQTVKVRVLDHTNVVVMFHRYNDRDFAAMLLEEGGWEYMRFPAVSDMDEEWPDALGRAEPGIGLSPRFSPEFYAQFEEKDALTWYGQFQGLPRPASGGFFQAEWLTETEDYSPYLDELPRPPAVVRAPWEPQVEQAPGAQFTTWVRAWDIAAGAKKRNDHNVGALMTMASDGTLILADVQRFKAEWSDTRERIIAQAALDASYFPGCYTVVEKKGIGEIAVRDLQAQDQFLRSPFKALEPPHGEEKMLRAQVWQAKLANRQFKLVRGPWNAAFTSELLSFHGLPGGRDDQVDAVSLAVQFLAQSGGGELSYAQPIRPDTHEYFRKLAELLRVQDGSERDRTHNPWAA